ncbi:ABC transporter ATP-binding protein [Pseudonocardia benzenivorans]|uniref:ABC transporter ATP-binding protein n=1 Tax=Pseudonocardia benzenivorans TaxID=228005 RepID=A0ABW3VCQ8_9PSEU
MTTSLEKDPAATDTTVAPLQVTDLTTTFVSRYRSVDVVRGVSFTLRRGETMMLLGESGSGKSVTARSIMQLYGSAAKIGGSVTMNGRELLGLPAPELRSLRGGQVALIPQDPTGALDPLRRIGSQLVEVLGVHGVATTKQAARRRAEELLAMVGIPDPKRVADSYPHQLSGGMRQRAVIAIAVSCDPQVLIADEPTTALDVTVQAQILELIVELQQRSGTAVLMVTHDVGVARDFGGRIGVMYAGRLVEEGPAAQVLGEPRHPYTSGLLPALPTPGVARGALRSIVGSPPPVGAFPAGCAFAPRCPQARPSCHEQDPPLVTVAPDRAAACPVANPGPAQERAA